MARLIKSPSIIKSVGTKNKIIKEFIGAVNTEDFTHSIALMESPSGWEEPGQTPLFDEYTIVLKGLVHVKTRESEFDVEQGSAFHAETGEWVQYSTPGPEGALYISVCIPAFTQGTVNRDGG